MTHEITLPVGASAEPDTCGSCKFFERANDSYASIYRKGGWCRIKMPPNKEVYAIKPFKEGDDEYWGPNKANDTDRCDLYRHDGKVYIVQRRIPPERIG